jgi:hypothetical protein
MKKVYSHLNMVVILNCAMSGPSIYVPVLHTKTWEWQKNQLQFLGSFCYQCIQFSPKHLISCILSRVRVSVTVINCGLRIWSLNLLDFIMQNYSYSLHRFTTRKPETCLLVRYHFTSYLIVHSLAVSLLTVCRLFLFNCFSSARSSVWRLLSSASSDLLCSPPSS